MHCLWQWVYSYLQYNEGSRNHCRLSCISSTSIFILAVLITEQAFTVGSMGWPGIPSVVPFVSMAAVRCQSTVFKTADQIATKLAIAWQFGKIQWCLWGECFPELGPWDFAPESDHTVFNLTQLMLRLDGCSSLVDNCGFIKLSLLSQLFPKK